MSLCSISKSCVRFMLILTDDDFSHLYIPSEQIKTVSFLFPSPNNEKSKMAATDKQKSGFGYIITNNEHKNTNSKSFVVSNQNGQDIIFR